MCLLVALCDEVGYKLGAIDVVYVAQNLFYILLFVLYCHKMFAVVWYKEG